MQTLTGQCLCGEVQFQATADSPDIWVCHCRMCRRWVSTGMMAVHAARLDIDSGDRLHWYPSSEWGERGFCSHCGSSLFWRGRGPADGHLAVSAGALSDQSALLLKGHIFIDEKPAYYEYSDAGERLTGTEVMADFD